jgi:hypothetical protein
MSTVLLDTTDLGEAEEILSSNYTKMRFGAPADATTHTCSALICRLDDGRRPQLRLRPEL